MLILFTLWPPMLLALSASAFLFFCSVWFYTVHMDLTMTISNHMTTGMQNRKTKEHVFVLTIASTSCHAIENLNFSSSLNRYPYFLKCNSTPFIYLGGA